MSYGDAISAVTSTVKLFDFHEKSILCGEDVAGDKGRLRSESII